MKQMLTEVVFRGRKLYFVDGSCISWTEVVFRGRKLYFVDGSCISWTEVVFRGRKLYSVDGSCGRLSQNSKSQNEFR